ncbi:MAG: phosphatidylglycerophosphatase A [Syntrophales bacterium]|nr:phosphatidylglycerophosphatase A [Syntrophales bacterium]
MKFTATGFGSGFVPLAPGTAGTIVGIPIYLIFSFLSWPYYLVTILVFTCLAWYLSRRAEKIFDEKDSPHIVIDEIVGLQYTMFLVAPTVLHVFLGFLLFRFFDIVKCFPASYFERKLPDGYGVVADDIVAGIYSNMVLLFLTEFWGI